MLEANNPQLKSWVKVTPDSDFPIQNLPFGIFRIKNKNPRVGVAIGKQIIDLSRLCKNGFLKDCGIKKNVFRSSSLNSLLSLGKLVGRNVRERVSELLRSDNPELREYSKMDKMFVRQKKVEMLIPVKARDYTDFYSSIEHATNVGTMFRDPENALLPNWRHLPVGYHGRAGSIVVSGTPVQRPLGQTKAPEAATPSFGPSKRLDFELEMAFVTCGKTNLGESISIQDTDDFIFGFMLFNDWSARDMQTWEYVPLGPFLAKNFASSVSPWVVTMDALEPFKVPGPKQEPEVLPYLRFAGERNYDIDLEVSITPEAGEENVISRSNFRYMYWNVAQQLAHHTVNGCNINPGDIYASGTISGHDPSSYGSMLELAWKGTKPIQLSDGSQRTFINDGDTVIMRGNASNNGVRIGFGKVISQVLPARKE